MGSRDFFVGSSQGNPERRVPTAQQCNRSTKCQHWGMFSAAAEDVAVIETPSLQWFQLVRGKETRPSLQLNLCER